MKQTKKTKIKEAILLYFEKPEHEFYGHHLTSAVINRTGLRYVYPGTVLRYSREMRQAGQINFICLLKRDSLYKSVK